MNCGICNCGICNCGICNCGIYNDLGRNAIVVIVSASIAFALSSQGKKDVFTLVKKLPEGIPSVKLPTVNKDVVQVIVVFCVL